LQEAINTSWCGISRVQTGKTTVCHFLFAYRRQAVWLSGSTAALKRYLELAKFTFTAGLIITWQVLVVQGH
jgi:hypothetical protein